MELDIQRIEQGLPESAPAAADSAIAGAPLEQLIDQLARAFRPITVTPTTTMAEVQYSAGQMAVIDWIRHRATKAAGRPIR